MSATDFFLKIDGIDGESEDEQFPNHIELLSWSFGATNSGSSAHGGGGGTGIVSMQDFHFTMKLNKGSCQLFNKVAGGDHIGEGVMHCRKSTGDKQEWYLKYTFNDLVISSYQTGGSGGGGADYPTEQISFNFSKIKIEYRKQDKKGVMSNAGNATWDVKLRKRS